MIDDLAGPATRKRRFLLVTLDAAGNWPPERVLVEALVSRGHDVRVLSNAAHAAEIAAIGARHCGYDRALERDPSFRHGDSPADEMARVFRNVLLNRGFADALLDELQRDAPDVLLVDQMLLMAAAAAESARLPTALLWHTVVGARAGSARRVPEALFAPLNQFRASLGLGPVADRWPIVGGADAIVACTYGAFDVVPADLPNLHYVGPLACVSRKQESYRLPWPTDDRRPLVLISYSTSFQNQVGLLQRVADGLADRPLRALLTLGRAIAASELRLAPNIVAERFVPHAAVLPHARVVVTHAGHGTVMAAVTAGVPLVCTPMGRDQHAVAGCVERCGLGTVLPMTASAEELRAAIEAAIVDEALHERAQTFASQLDVNAGLRTAVGVLEGLGTQRVRS